MLVSKASRRYAIALLEFAKEQKKVDQVLQDILFIKNTLDDSRELILFLKSPVIKPAVKKSALAAIFEAKVSKEVWQFIVLIADKNRESIFSDIMNAFVEAYNDHAGIIQVDVKTATALSDKQQQELIAMLGQKTGKTVELNLILQEDLRGGISIKIEDTVIDATIKHKLEQLENTFLDSSMG